jgi:hypothetical protein
VFAIYIEEYVPNITPKIIARENPLRISPPKKNIANNANNVVIEVINVLDNVSLIEMFVNSKILISEYFRKFSLTLSKITTVSFIEYPTIVSTAAIIDKFISKLNNENKPKVIITS